MCLVHLDFHQRNVLRIGSGVSAIVDWEGARLGDRALDLVGCTRRHLRRIAREVTHQDARVDKRTQWRFDVRAARVRLRTSSQATLRLAAGTLIAPASRGEIAMPRNASATSAMMTGCNAWTLSTPRLHEESVSEGESND
jgi:hypothetical protein